MLVLLTWLLGAVALVNFFAAAAVYLRGSRDKGTIETLTRSNDALQENNKILNDRVTLLETSDTSKGEKIAAQDKTIEVLTNTVNSSELIKTLSSELSMHHKAAMTGVAQIHTDLAELPKKIALVLKEKA